MSISELGTLVWFVVLLVWPGGCILWLTRSAWVKNLSFTPGGALWLAVPVSFALSLGMVSIMGWVGYLLNLGFYNTCNLYLALVSGLTLLSFALYSLNLKHPWLNRSSQNWTFSWRTIWIEMGLLILIVIATGTAAYAGPWLSHTADSFSHISAIRGLSNYDRALPHEVFFDNTIVNMSPTHGTWHLALALVAHLAGTDAIDIWQFATVAVTPLVVLAFAVFALTLTQKPDVALLATIFHFGLEVLGTNLDVRMIARPNRMGHLMLWLVITFVVAYGQTLLQTRQLSFQVGETFYGRHINLLFISLIAFGMSAMHMMYTPGLVALLGTTFGVLAAAWIAIKILYWLQFISTPPFNLIFGNNRPTPVIPAVPPLHNFLPRRLWLASGLAVGAVMPVFLYRTVILVSSPKTSLTTGSDQVTTEAAIGWLANIDLNFWYPALLSVPVLVTVLLPLFAKEWLRGRLGAAVVIAGVILVPIATIVFTIFLGNGGLVFTTIRRLAKLIPALVYVALGWQLVLIGGWLATLFKLPPERVTWGPLKPGMAFAVLLVAGYILTQAMKDPLLIYSPDSDYNLSLKVSQEADLTLVWQDVLTQLRQLPPDTIIFSDIDTAYMLAGLTGLQFTALPSQHVSVNEKSQNRVAYYDTVDFMAGELSPTEMVRVLEQHQVDYVFIGEPRFSGEQAWQTLTGLPVLAPVASGTDWMLLRYQPDKTQPFLEFAQQRTTINGPDELVDFYGRYSNLFADQNQFALYVTNDIVTGSKSSYPIESGEYLAFSVIDNLDIQTLPAGNSVVKLTLANAWATLGQDFFEQFLLTDSHNFQILTAYFFQKAVGLTPDNSIVQQAILRAYQKTNDSNLKTMLEQSLAAYHEAIAQAPDDLDRYWELAETYQKLGRWDKAMALYLQAVEQQPNDHVAHYRLARAYQTQGQVAEALEQYDRALTLQPDWARVYQIKHSLYLRQKQSEQAVMVYEHAAAQNPTAAWPRLELGQWYLEQARR